MANKAQKLMEQYEKVLKIIHDDANKLGLKFFGMSYLYDPSEETLAMLDGASQAEKDEFKTLKNRAMPPQENDDVHFCCLHTDLDEQDARVISHAMYDNVLKQFSIFRTNGGKKR